MVRGSFWIGVWKEIRKEWVSFFSNTLCSLGNGRRAHFWKDILCWEEPLFVAFPSLFAMAENKEARVVDMWESFMEEGGWSPRFSRSFNDWEIEEVLNFLLIIQEKRIIPNQEDVML